MERFTRLSPKEREVLSLMMKGLNACEIAETLYVSVPTIRTQLRSIFQKLQVKSQIQAMALAYTLNWNTEK